MEITIADLERATGFTFRTIKKRLAKIEPTRHEGSRIYYDSKDALKILYLGANSKKEISLEIERAYLARSQRHSVDLEYQPL